MNDTSSQINDNSNVCATVCSIKTLQWRHNGRDGVSNHQPHHYLLNRLFRHRSKKNIKAPRHWPLCREFTGDRRIPCTNGQLRWKCFLLVTSSLTNKTLKIRIDGPFWWESRCHRWIRLNKDQHCPKLPWRHPDKKQWTNMPLLNEDCYVWNLTHWSAGDAITICIKFEHIFYIDILGLLPSWQHWFW